MLTAVPGHQDDQVARLEHARSTRRFERPRPEVFDVRDLGKEQRRDAPLERHLLHRRLMVREPDDRPARPQPRNGRGRPARVARHEHRLGAERLGQVAGRIRHREPDGRPRRRATGGDRSSTARRPARSDPSSRTASTGYAPTAVSAESITADVPSRIAFATSLASARVGSACSIIDSSICVAVITGLPASRQRRMIRFCISGTVAAPTSTPRSPRATITASASARISSSASTASAFSIFAITCAVEPCCAR